MKVLVTLFILFLTSLTYSQTCNDTILVPNAFTPTLTTNTNFYPYINSYDDYRMKVYNRWGNLIYEGKQWDGTYKSQLCDPDVYVWVITVFKSDCKKDFRGTITLIK
jgi:gliding motility-associated-like protein